MRSGDMVKTDIRNMPWPASAIHMVRHIGLKKFLILVSINPLLKIRVSKRKNDFYFAHG